MRNDQATSDVPVGVLCNLLRGMRSRDVGTGGFDGFLESIDQMHVVKYHRGGHAAALTDENLTDAADFILTGTFTQPAGLKAEPSKKFAFFSRLCLHLPLMVLLAVAAGVVWAVSAPPWVSIALTVLAGHVAARSRQELLTTVRSTPQD